jgi:4-hydroxybenzoate polyprenyltransferase
MLRILVLALIVLVALAVLSFALHFLLSPWLWLVAIGGVAWLTFRSRRSRRQF